MSTSEPATRLELMTPYTDRRNAGHYDPPKPKGASASSSKKTSTKKS